MKTKSMLLILCSILLIFISGCASPTATSPAETASPAVEATEAPVAEATEAPAVEATEAPAVEATEAPAEEAVDAQKPVNIALFIVVLGNSYNQASVDGATQMAEKMGATVTVFDANYDASKQVQQMQDAITSQKYDAFMLYPVDGAVIMPEVDDSVAAGILVGNVGNGIVGSTPDELKPYNGISIVAGVTSFSQGAHIGERIVEECGDKNPCKLVYIAGKKATTADSSRLRGLHSIIDQHPEIEMVAEEEASYTQDKALSVMQNLVLAHPDINVVATSGDQMSIGASLAIEDAGLKDSIVVLGLGASKEGIQAIKDGQMKATFALIPYSEAALVAEQLINAVRGTPIENNTVDIAKLSPPLLDGGPWIDLNNIDLFQAEW